MTKKRMPSAPYPDVDDAAADATRPKLAAGALPPPPAIPGKDASVRPLIDGREVGVDEESPVEVPKTAAARDPEL